MVIKFSNM